MRRNPVKRFIDDRPVTKKEFSKRMNAELKATHVACAHLVKHKVLSKHQIETAEASGLLHAKFHKGRKFFLKEDVKHLIESQHANIRPVQRPLF